MQIDCDMHYFSIQVLIIKMFIMLNEILFIFLTFLVSLLLPLLVDVDWACAVLGHVFCWHCRLERSYKDIFLYVEFAEGA